MALFEGARLEEAKEIIGRYPEGRERSAIMPLLYLAQSVEGHVSREGLQEIAGLLDLTTAEVEAVASFYSMYRLRPTGTHVVNVCTNLACMLRGAREVVRGRAPGRRDAPRPGAVRRRAHHAPRRGVPGRLRLRPGRAGQLREPRQGDARADAGADRGRCATARSPSRRAGPRDGELQERVAASSPGSEEAPAS